MQNCENGHKFQEIKKKLFSIEMLNFFALLFELDVYLNNGKENINLYSFPNFFINFLPLWLKFLFWSCRSDEKQFTLAFEPIEGFPLTQLYFTANFLAFLMKLK
jgi:hypothetical protein